MTIKMLIACIPALILLISDFCSGWGIISIKLVDYKNPSSTVFNGECCDTPSWCSLNSCENYFKFCVTSLGSLDPCNLGSSTTRVLGDDDFTFPAVGQSLGTNLLNPLTYNFSYWQGSTVVVEVWDDDGAQIVGKLHDFVDKYTLTLNKLQSAYPDLQSSIEQTEKLCGQSSCMTVTVTLYCGPNYLVPDCLTYCVSRNDNLGHYHCNYTAGRKVCHEGWYDPLTDCVKKKKFCTVRNDSMGHYNCDPISGEKLCLDGWTGENCTQVCSFSPCHPDNFKSTTNHIPGSSSSLKSKPLTATVTLTPTTHAYLSRSEFAISQSTAFYFITSSSASSIFRISSVTELQSILHTSLHFSTVPHNYQTPALRSLVSAQTSLSSSSSSSLSLVSSLSSSVASSLSPSSTSLWYKTTTHATVSFLTSPVTRTADRSSVVPSSTPAHQTDGIEIELKPYRNWTTGKDEQVRKELVNKINEFCAKSPLSCLITSNTTLNGTVFNTSHVIMKIKNSSNGKVWVRVKVKLPETVPLLPGSGYLPSVVLKRIVLENKVPLEKNLGAEIVTVREVAWGQPTLPPINSSVSLITLMTVTDPPTTLQDYYSSFLPYLLVALCLIAAFIVGFAFYRRSKLREARILPEPESNKSEEELITLPSRKSSTNTRPRSAPDDTNRTGNHQSDLKPSKNNPDGSHRNKYMYRFRSESRLRELTESDSESSGDEETDDRIFLTKSRLREMTEIST